MVIWAAAGWRWRLDVRVKWSGTARPETEDRRLHHRDVGRVPRNKVRLITRDNPSHAHRASSLKLIEPGRTIPLRFLYGAREPRASIFISRAIISPVLCGESGGYRLGKPWHRMRITAVSLRRCVTRSGPSPSWHLHSSSLSVSRTQL